MTNKASQPTTPTMDQALAALREAHGARSPLVKRIVAVRQASEELFDAAEALAEWMRTVPVEYRHIARFNRLYDAIAGVREAHQMEPDHVLR